MGVFSYYLCFMQFFEVLPNHSWLIVDDYSKKQITGSDACRQLLKKTQQKLSIKGILQQQNFPYYLDKSSPIYFVSFSHSPKKIAILLSLSAKIGVDIETKPVSQQVAERFFTLEESSWIKNLHQNQQITIRKLLWTLKESFIKQQANKNSQLVAGLQQNMFLYLSKNQLLQLIISNNQLNIIQNNEQVFAFYPEIHCGLIIDCLS